MAAKVKFLRGSREQFDALTKNSNTFYYCEDTKEFYLGDVLLSNGNIAVDLADAIQRIATLEDKVDIPTTVSDALDALAAVAKTGAAADVNIQDSGGDFTSTNVEGALTEIMNYIGDIPASSEETNIINYINEQISENALEWGDFADI